MYSASIKANDSTQYVPYILYYTFHFFIYGTFLDPFTLNFFVHFVFSFTKLPVASNLIRGDK